MTLSISPDRLVNDLARLAEFGSRPDGGVDRVAGTRADLEARRWLVAAMSELGLQAGLDEANNAIGHPRDDGPWLLLGSHTDTVPAGGRLDGAYGVMASLEVYRTLTLNGDSTAGRIAIVSFHDEEGVGGHSFQGSLHFCSSDFMDSVSGFVELHIEQGPQLDAAAIDIGVVEGIVGIDRYNVEIIGQANHAGTTPYQFRRDAGRAAARFMVGLPEIVMQVEPTMVANVGAIQFEPGSPNVIPGAARFVLEVRCRVQTGFETAHRKLSDELNRIAVGEGCTATINLIESWPATPMHPGYVAELERVCQRGGRTWRRLVSGAGHDAAILARHVPTAMIFVPSRDGISHSPLEYTDTAKLAIGCQVLFDMVKALA